MTLNDWTYRLFRPDHESPTLEDCVDTFKTLQILDVPFVDPVDISNAVLFLGSDEARRTTASGSSALTRFRHEATRVERSARSLMFSRVVGARHSTMAGRRIR